MNGYTYVRHDIIRNGNINTDAKFVYLNLAYLDGNEDIKENQKRRLMELTNFSDKKIDKLLSDLIKVGYVQKCEYIKDSKKVSYYDIKEEYKYHGEE
ncbi:hypothetical protein FORC3_1203 [Clostridium perfringens]|uniref:hypothetical protein n=1 Tax=Clostridium perfringens TaxID=1502 RepID=UPI000706673B|nr:hypothetical protein [Clostridium perfringens]ALG48580.1 hypothetical protein FORC3_1203 [Clostridium perfringens]